MEDPKMQFAKLDDSPMFRQQIQCLEEVSEILRERSVKFHKGCRKYTEGLREGYDRDIAFASSLESFGGGHNDPICMAFGGPEMTKFAIALREIATYKEILRSQVNTNFLCIAALSCKSYIKNPKLGNGEIVLMYKRLRRKIEHTLNDRLLHFVNVEVQDVKEARKRFDKANAVYDQAREKFLSLRKSTRIDIAAAIEEELQIARLTFEQARFNLVGALSSVEAKTRFEFLDAVSETMDSHLRYFKQGYELLHQMEPYINQVLAYAQQSRESYWFEQAALNEKVEEYKRQIAEENKLSSSVCQGPTNGDLIQSFPRSSHKLIEEVMQSAATEGKVQTIKQGYLSKRSSNLRGDWKRRFFVLDNRGMLYYYRKQGTKPSGSGNPPEPGSGLLSRWLSSHYHGGVHDEKSVAHHTVNLLTSTIKVDADQSDLRFCFRIISPMKIYTLQAESAPDQMDWIEKITGVIASLLSSQTHERRCSASSASEFSSVESSPDHDQRAFDDYASEKDRTYRHTIRASRSSQQLQYNVKSEKPVDSLKKIPGNDICADCGAPEPDWASLNLGVLICIECSGIHRNLGVHISKVRSLALDVKVWEPSVINLFQALGNVFVNSIWEKLLHARRTFQADEIPMRFVEPDKSNQFFKKPSHDDHISEKERFIHAKYAEKRFVHKIKGTQHLSVAHQLWENVRANDKKAVYGLIVICEADINAVHGHTSPVTSLSLSSIMHLHDQENVDHNSDFVADSADNFCSRSFSSMTESDDPCVDEFLDGCSLLHLACQTADSGMVELLLQHGANVNASDSRGHTPLHHCILRGRIGIAKQLLTRGADPLATDVEGKTAHQLVMDLAVDDVELLALLRGAHR